MPGGLEVSCKGFEGIGVDAGGCRDPPPQCAAASRAWPRTLTPPPVDVFWFYGFEYESLGFMVQCCSLVTLLLTRFREL